MERVRQSLETRTRVHLLTGFLGGGKTTLLQRYLASKAADDTAVLINEFGAVSLDHGLIGAADDVVEVLADGCLCCTVVDRLGQSLRALLARRKRHGRPFRELIIETSGLACPEPILNTIRADYVLDEYLEIGSVVATLDCRDADHVLDHYGEAARQLCAADRIVLTKPDLVDGRRVEQIKAMARALNPIAVIDTAADLASAMGGLFERRDDAPRPSLTVPERGRHQASLRSVALTYDEPLDWARFSLWLTAMLNRHGRSLLRFKGVLQVAGYPWPLVIHSVQHLMYPPRHLARLPKGQSGSALVFITDGLDPQRIVASLDRCMAQSGLPMAA